MNLIIEQGNTAVKVAVFDGEIMLISSVFDHLSESDLLFYFQNYSLDYGILSTVSDFDSDLIVFLKKHLHVFYSLNDDLRLPVRIVYDTPETLGKDRIAAITAANYLEPNRNVLVIDAGTAITYDLVYSSGIFTGGNISPGMTTRFRALNYFTKRLPLISERDDIPLLGSSTETAILAGVVNGIIYEMDGYITDLRREYPDLFVFLTGGHSFYFERRLKNSIFAAINLVLIGLNRILEYNVESQ